jgi:hypothetical protein
VIIIHEPRRDAAPESVALFNGSRKEIGVENSRVEEKFTLDELTGFIRDAGIGDGYRVTAPKAGRGGMAVEIVLTKP